MKTPSPNTPRFASVNGLAKRLSASLPKLILSLSLAVSAANAASYYVDPATGSMANAGTSAAPWSTLEAVFTAGKTFAAGDVIHLRNGHHGAPQVRGFNSGTVFIQPQSGHAPTLKFLDVENASYWTISDLRVSPFYAGTTLTNDKFLCFIRPASSYITIQNCTFNSVADSVDVKLWSVADWGMAAIGARVEGPHSQLINNTFTNVDFGIRVMQTAPNSLITGNTVTNFSKDGMLGLADNCEFSYNTILNSYLDEDNDGDANHDDGFQSWATNSAMVVSNVTLRGNIFIGCTDPNQPHKGEMQGIGCFDGWFENFVVENNVVVVSMTSGIEFLGATNCRIVNNTVVKNPMVPAGKVPKIQVEKHKNGSPSSGNLIRNNFAPTWWATGTYTADHNIFSQNYAAYFIDYPNLDLHLKAGSTAIDAGSTTLAPSIDCDQLPRSVPYDIGCFEYQAAGSSNAHGGTWSLKSVLSSTPSYTNVAQMPTGIATGNTYVAKLWIKGSGSVRLTVRAGNWGTTLATLQCNATSTWTQVTTAPFSTGSNTQLTVVLQDQYGTAGTVYMDDVFLGVDGGANKLANPGFESGNTSWTVAGSIWTIGQHDQSANVHTGTWSLKSLLSSTPSWSNAAQAPTGIATGNTYVGSVWIKGSGSVQLKVLAGSWGSTLATVPCNATSTWTQVTTPAFSTGSNTQLTFVLIDQYGTGGTVYLDDAFLGVSGGANKLANPGFESGNASWSISNGTVWSTGQY